MHLLAFMRLLAGGETDLFHLFCSAHQKNQTVALRSVVAPKACDGFREHEALADVGVQIRPAIAHPFKQLELVHSRNSLRQGRNESRPINARTRA
jgi:hypothetical protein